MTTSEAVKNTSLLAWMQILLVQCLVVLLMLEVALRVWYFFHNRAEPPFAYMADEIGWRPSANLSFAYQRDGYGEIHYSSVRDGFRSYGNINSNAIKILAVGDSFTQAYHVSDAKPYYDRLQQRSNGVETFAIAAGGYGTLQQAMLIDKYSPEISPDLVIWQFSGNDFIDNDWKLESQSSENSNHMSRPYWEKGKSVVRHPDGKLGNLAEYSLLVRRLLVIRGSFQKRNSGSIEQRLDINHPDLQQSIATTRQVIRNTVAKYPSSSYYAFFAGREYYTWELSAFSQICEVNEIQCMDSVHQALAKAAQNGEVIDGGNDGHWNERGHDLAGEAILQALNNYGILR